jgi:hypothetical protein
MKQTAVEWFIKQLPLIQQEGLRDVIEEAKEMEKQQIIEAYNDGQAIPPFDYADKYYNRNYNSK